MKEYVKPSLECIDGSLKLKAMVIDIYFKVKGSDLATSFSLKKIV